MIDDTTNTPESTAADAWSGEYHEAVTAFCQQCGRPLTSSLKRQVGSGIFCAPCANTRTAGAAGWAQVNGAGTGGSYGVPVAARSAEPNPVLGGFLGLIPGVGAMYNGQYPKGALHLIVFVVLVSLADNLNWVFWWFVWGWIFYQAFDAYHTAQARRDGQPLPDPFGWSEWGERFGVGRGWQSTTPSARAYAPKGTPGPDPYASAAAPVPPPPTEWAERTASHGEAPYTSYPSAAAQSDYRRPESVPPSYPFNGAAAAPIYPGTGTDIPYMPIYTGVEGGSAMPNGAFPTASRFPTGAAWLIGLGVLFLLGNVLPSWRLDGRWFVPILLAGIAIWTGVRRLSTLPGFGRSGLGAGSASLLPVSLAGLLLGPAVLLTLGVLLALQAASIMSFRHSWPAILIVWGGLLAVERSRPVSNGAGIPPEPAAAAPSDLFPS